MLIRAYRADDAGPTRAIFERAVHRSAATHYAPAQLDAWAPRADPEMAAEWAARRAAARTVVAVAGTRVVGFSDLVGGCLLDMLFVDPEYGRRGVATELIAAVLGLARESGAHTVEVHASLTARPVLERSGFVVVAEQTPVIRGVALANFIMRAELGA